MCLQATLYDNVTITVIIFVGTYAEMTLLRESKERECETSSDCETTLRDQGSDSTSELSSSAEKASNEGVYLLINFPDLKIVDAEK